MFRRGLTRRTVPCDWRPKWQCDIHTGETLHTFNDEVFERPLLFYSMDGKRLLAVNSSEIMGNFGLWDVETGVLLQKFVMAVYAHTSLGVAISPDGTKLAVHDEVGISVFDMNASRVQITSKQLQGPHHLGRTAVRVAKLAWSRDGARIATASAEDDMVSVWPLQLENGRHIQSRVGLEAWRNLCCLTFSPDLSLLAGVQMFADGTGDPRKECISGTPTLGN